MENIPDIYTKPYNSAYPVICFDEKPYQLTGHVTEPLPPEPGRPRRDDYHYKRSGVCNILCAFEPATGKRVVRITQHRTRQDYAGFMKEPGGLYPGARRIRLVQDNLDTRTGGSFYETFDGETVRSLVGRFEFHYTPQKAGWLNMVEIELSALSKNCIDRRIASAEELQRIIEIRVQQRMPSPAG